MPLSASGKAGSQATVGGGNLWKSSPDCFIVSVKWEIGHQVRVGEGEGVGGSRREEKV